MSDLVERARNHEGWYVPQKTLLLQLADRIEGLESKLAKLEPVKCHGCKGCGELPTSECSLCDGTGTLPATHVIVPVEPTFEQLDKVLHDLGVDNPKVSKQWLREFYKAMIQAAQEAETP